MEIDNIVLVVMLVCKKNPNILCSLMALYGALQLFDEVSKVRDMEAVDLANPSAATGFGLGGGARPLRAGVQQARPLRSRRAGPRGVGSALDATARRDRKSVV